MTTTRDAFPEVLPTVSTRYCFSCGADAVSSQKSGDVTKYLCATCGVVSDRFLTWDPILKATFDANNRLVHYGGGAFVRNPEGKFLLIRQAKFPFLWTIPGGHLEVGEDPKLCALREVQEETSLIMTDMTMLFEGVLEGDSCVGGADVHFWYLYLGTAKGTVVTQDAEVTGSRWVSLSEIDTTTITYPLQFFLANDSVRKILEA
ncbi:MAG: NUDIX hydrolase [Minisyncoccia bacterium]